MANDDDTTPMDDDTTPMDDDTTPPMRACNLNDFPEDILVHIISFLPTYDAIRTSIISSRWRNLWTTISSLKFDYPLFPPSPESTAGTRRRFADFVNRTILCHRFPSPLKFRLQFDFGDNFWSHVESWIHYAVNRGVLELDIDFYADLEYCSDSDDEHCYDFHFLSLANCEIRDLKICWCDLTVPYAISGFKLASINSIHLSHVYIWDVMVSNLISVCVNLESLVLDDCSGMEKLWICSKKLKNLSLWRFLAQNGEESWVEICCPNLRMISIRSFKTGKYLIKQADSLVEARVKFSNRGDYLFYWNKVVRLFDGVQRLKVQNWWYQFFEQKDDSLKKLAFNKLRILEIQTRYSKHDVLGLASLFEISPNLHTLILDYLYKPSDEDEKLSEEVLDKPINLRIPKLKEVKVKHFMGTEGGQFKFLKLLEMQGTVLEKIVVFMPQLGLGADPIVLRRQVPLLDLNSSPPTSDAEC